MPDPDAFISNLITRTPLVDHLTVSLANLGYSTGLPQVSIVIGLNIAKELKIA